METHKEDEELLGVVSGLVMGITRVTTWNIGAINLLAKSP